MASLNTIKNWFKTGLKPTQTQFWSTWDSFFHKDEKIPQGSIEGLQDSFNAKADTEGLSTVATSGSYTDLENAPVLASVATSGSYTDLTDIPEESNPLWKGEHTSLANLKLVHPIAEPGSFANIDEGAGFDVRRALWDVSDEDWMLGAVVVSMELGETSDKAYYGDKGKIAYDHSQTSHFGTPQTFRITNSEGTEQTETTFTQNQILRTDNIDLSDISVGEKKILTVQKLADGTAVVSEAIAQIDKLAPPSLGALLAETNPLWDGDQITVTGDNRQGNLGENSQEYVIGSDFFLCTAHSFGTTSSDGYSTWVRNRGQDCLTVGLTHDDSIIAALESETGWNTADYKVLSVKSKQGTWYRKNTGEWLYLCINKNNGWTRVGYVESYVLTSSRPTDAAIISELITESGWSVADYKQTTNASRVGYWYANPTDGYFYKCIDLINGWIRVGSPYTEVIEITSASHLNLTTNLKAHDFTTGFYTESTHAANEPAAQGQEYWDETASKWYKRNMNGFWAKM